VGSSIGLRIPNAFFFENAKKVKEEEERRKFVARGRGGLEV